VDQGETAAEIAHRRGALLIMVFTEAVSLGLIEPPADADIVAGELQSFAISPATAARSRASSPPGKSLMRQMPGRPGGQTNRFRGNRAFCLTLFHTRAAIRRREGYLQHLHQPGLIALMATVFMTVYGKQGLRELAEQNRQGALPGGRLKPRFTGPFFKRIRSSNNNPDAINKALLKKKIIGGLRSAFLPRAFRLPDLMRHRNVAPRGHGCRG